MNQEEIRNNNCKEDREVIKKGVDCLLNGIGEDPLREGLIRTPERVARACEEWYGGYCKDPKDVLNRTFPSKGYNDMVVIRNIRFYSNCEHHITPFFGFTHIAVIAGDRIVGLDKYIKLVDIFARRLQTQEVMTTEICEAIVDVLKPKGAMVIIEGKHLCVASRETKNDSAEFVTTHRYGLFEEDISLESRFLQYINKTLR